MDITKEKSKVFGQIAALRVSSESFPLINTINSIKSISKKVNSLDFLIDLVKSLMGYEALKDTLIDILTYKLDDIELEVKEAIKTALKSLVSCSINPSIPSTFANDGVTLELSKIDLLNMFKVNPTSESGKLLYNDNYTGTNSSDFNTFLYETIQDNGGTNSWGNQVWGDDILNIKFTQESYIETIPNNTINIKPSASFASGSLTELNNKYIDSIKLFETNKLINDIIESIFGTISVNTNKDKRTIETELKIQEIIDRIINSDDMVIDDSYFNFTNEDLSIIETKSEARRKGISIISTTEEIDSSIPIKTLSKINENLDDLINEPSTPQLMELKTTIVRGALDSLANDSSNNVDNVDRDNVKVNLIENMLRTIMNSIVNVILSPKLISILAINHTIIYGQTFNGIEDFMKKNKTLLTSILNSVREAIISLLMERVLKEIKVLVFENIVKTQVEMLKNKKAQLASLVSNKLNKVNDSINNII